MLKEIKTTMYVSVSHENAFKTPREKEIFKNIKHKQCGICTWMVPE